MKTVRFLMRSIRENKRNALLSMLLVTLEVVCECALPFVMAKLIDNSGVDWNSLLIYGAILIVLASGALACGILSGRASARAAAGLCANLRKDMFVKVQNYSFSNIDKYSASGARYAHDDGRYQYTKRIQHDYPRRRARTADDYFFGGNGVYHKYVAGMDIRAVHSRTRRRYRVYHQQIAPLYDASI